GERRAAIALRRDEGAASDVAAEQAARFELAIGGDDGGARDAQRRRQLAFGRQPAAGRQRAARDAAVDQLDQAAVERSHARDGRAIDVERLKQANRRLVLFDAGERHDPDSMTTTIYAGGRFVNGEDAAVSVLDHGLLYGDGIFEGIRAYNGRVFKLDRHLDR